MGIIEAAILPLVFDQEYSHLIYLEGVGITMQKSLHAGAMKNYSQVVNKMNVGIISVVGDTLMNIIYYAKIAKSVKVGIKMIICTFEMVFKAC